MNDSNETNDTTFNCLADISSTTISNRTFWEIRLKEGAPVVAVVFVIFFIIAFGWNLFIIITFLSKKRLLREPANILLLNLAIADLMVAMTQIFFSMVTEAALEYVFGQTDAVRCSMCDLTGVLFMLLYGVSMHTLAALSFDRFLLLYKPFRYKKMMTRVTTIVIVITIWVISLILAIPPLVGFGQIEFNRRFGSCVPRFGEENINSGVMNFFYVGYVALESLFPIVTIAVCSFWTYWFINKFLKRNYRRRSFYSSRGRNSMVQQQQEDSRYHRQQQQLVKVFGALLVSNIISWLPVLAVVLAVGAYGGDATKVPDAVYVVGWICYLTAPVVHPIIESFFVKDMRLVVCKGISRVNRASSFIARSTTGMFANKDMEMANEKVETEDDEEYVSQREIKFFRGKNNGNSNNKNKKKKRSKKRNRLRSNVSMVTEVTDIPLSEMHPGSQGSTPSPETTKKLSEMNHHSSNPLSSSTPTAATDGGDEDVQFRNKTEDHTSKPARRITFSDESPPLGGSAETPRGETPLAESPLSRNGVRRSALKMPRDLTTSLTPVGEHDVEDSNSSADGSVFNPHSPQQTDILIEGDPEPKHDGMESGTTTVPEYGNGISQHRDKLDSQESNESENASDIKLMKTSYDDQERRSSWTLV